MLIPLILTVAVANLLIGFALSVYCQRRDTSSQVTLPVWSDQDSPLATPPQLPYPLSVELPADNAGGEPGISQQWLDTFEELASTNDFVETSKPVMRLKIAAYRHRLVELDQQVRALLHEAERASSVGQAKVGSAQTAAQSDSAAEDEPGLPSAASRFAALHAVAEKLREVNYDWFQEQKQATEQLRNGQARLGNFSHIAGELEQTLLAQTAQVETTINNLNMFGHQCDPSEAAQRLLTEIERLLDHCHNLRDVMQTSIVEVLHVANRLSQLDRQTLLDRQSGLSNRGGLQRFLDEFREADTDSQRAISFGWIEVDQLRSVNERFGPHVGDLLVQAMGQLIGNVLRTERGADLGCRVLGNGFAAFLGDTGSHHGVFAVERIRQTVAQSTWLVDHKPLEVSVSCGVIEVLAEDALPELITRSRAACRYARSAGGNQTWLDEGHGPIAIQTPKTHVTPATFELSPQAQQ